MFIAFEGTDGSGKGEQTKLLVKHLKDSNHPVEMFDFPQYTQSFFGRIVGYMLAGQYGKMENIDPHLASLPYSLDRWKATPRIEMVQSEGKIAVANRFTLSNLAHQTARVPREKRSEFIKFILDLEWTEFKIPQPDLYIYLDVPSEISRELILAKAKRDYITRGKADLLEADIEHQLEAAKLYREFAILKRYFENIIRIPCCDTDGNLRSIENVHEIVWSKVKYFLDSYSPERTRRQIER